MKNLLLFLLFLTTTVSLSQSTTNNFIIENRQVIWQKVYESNLTQEELIEKFHNTGVFKNIVDNGDSFTGELIQLSMDFRGFDASYLFTTGYITDTHTEAFAVIEFKPGRYRVTLKNIKFIQKINTDTTPIGEITDLELYALRKKNTIFRNGFIGNPSGIMNHTFEKILHFKNDDIKDKW